MDGAVVEDDAMIAAGALVTPGTKVSTGVLFAGAPARFKRDLDRTERAGLKQAADNYLGYVEAYKL